MPLGNIAADSARFKRIAEGQIRKNLARYISREDFITKKREQTIRIPVPVIKIPRFGYGINVGGVGHGDGQIGDNVDPFANSNHGSNKGNDSPDTEDLMNLEMTVKELEDLVIEEVGLPNLEPKTNHQTLHTEKAIYKSIAEKGVIRNFKRSYKEALKRASSSGDYQPGDAVILSQPDLRYRSPVYLPNQQSNAVLIYMMDVSGSMGEKKRQLCRTTNSLLQKIISRYYHNLEERFIVHTTNAHEVEGKVFYETKFEGGTIISSAFQKSYDLIKEHYPPKEWNIYLFYYSDGDNYEPDNDKALTILGNMLLPAINMFSYAQCTISKGFFLNEMNKRFNLKSSTGSEIPRQKIRCATLAEEGDKLKTLKTFLNKDQVPFYQT